MKSEKCLALCAFLFCFFPQTPTNALASSEEELLIADTLRLLAVGEEFITLDPAYRDLVLLVGNTGSGKSTFGKFITGWGGELEAYWAGDRFLIRDTDGDISVNSTLISKSIFPQLMIHNETNTALYDLPGFSDTRNASVEIANAFFMKKVADHAARVKLLFVVNYSSVRFGESRTDFLNMVKQAIDLVKNVGKFDRGLGLVATKVESIYGDDLVTNGIADFLRLVLHDLAELIPDPTEQGHCSDLVKSLIEQYNATSYTRIGLFRAPDRAGNLSDCPGVMAAKPQLEKVIWTFTEFVDKAEEDFGLSLSASAKIIVLKLSVVTDEAIHHEITQMGEIIQKALERRIDESASKYQLLDFLIRHDRVMNERFSQDSEVIPSREELLTALNSTLDGLEIIGQLGSDTLQELRATIPRISVLFDRLKFFDEINETPGPVAPPARWLASIKYATSSFRREMTRLYIDIRDTLDLGFKNFHDSVTAKYRVKYRPDHNALHAFLHIQTDHPKITSLVTAIKPSTTLAEFASHNFPAAVSSWSITPPGGSIPLLPSVEEARALTFDPPGMAFDLHGWIRPLEELIPILNLFRDGLPAYQNPLAMTIPNDQLDGGWGGMDHCPAGTFVSGMQLKYDNGGGGGGETGLNGIKLFCSGAGATAEEIKAEITSKVGPWPKHSGFNGERSFCPGLSKAWGLELRAMEDLGFWKDDVGATNLKLWCDDGTVLEGQGGGGVAEWGSWYGVARCPRGQFPCGIQTFVQDETAGDEAALSAATMRCCSL